MLGFLVGVIFVFAVDDVFSVVVCGVLRAGLLDFVLGDVVGIVTGVVFVFGTVGLGDVHVVGVFTGDVFGRVVGDVLCLVVGTVARDVGFEEGCKHAALVFILVV